MRERQKAGVEKSNQVRQRIGGSARLQQHDQGICLETALGRRLLESVWKQPVMIDTVSAPLRRNKEFDLLAFVKLNILIPMYERGPACEALWRLCLSLARFLNDVFLYSAGCWLSFCTLLIVLWAGCCTELFQAT